MDSSMKSLASPLMTQYGWSAPKRSLIGHPHHIQSASVLKTSETGFPPFTPQASRISLTLLIQGMSGMGHPNPLSKGILT